MRILQVHNEYKNSPGGEDFAVQMDYEQLTKNGHLVEKFFVSNVGIDKLSIGRASLAAAQYVWSIPSYYTLLKKIKTFNPDIVHVHNTFAVLSPSIFWAIKRSRTPCILTLHNYRNICANSLLFREGRSCYKCLGKYPFAAFQHRCKYNNSFLAGATIATSQMLHRWLRTYDRAVNSFIVLGLPSKKIMVQAGVPSDKIFVRPNAIHDFHHLYDNNGLRERQFVFVGQITIAKGIDLLIKAWNELSPITDVLYIIGEGPDKIFLQEKYKCTPNIKWLGHQDRKNIFDIVARSKFLVMPSRWNEPFGLSAAESLMLSTPIIVPEHISLAHYISKENGGLSFSSNNLVSLVNTLRDAQTMTEERWNTISRLARQVYLLNFNPTKNHEHLIAIYSHTVEQYSHLKQRYSRD